MPTRLLLVSVLIIVTTFVAEALQFSHRGRVTHSKGHNKRDRNAEFTGNSKWHVFAAFLAK